MITNQEVYDNGEIQNIEYSRTIKGVKFYYIYTIFYNGNYYEVEVDNDEINTEVTHPDYEAVLINH